VRTGASKKRVPRVGRVKNGRARKGKKRRGGIARKSHATELKGGKGRGCISRREAKAIRKMQSDTRQTTAANNRAEHQCKKRAVNDNTNLKGHGGLGKRLGLVGQTEKWLKGL